MSKFSSILNSINDLSIENIQAILQSSTTFKKDKSSWPVLNDKRFCSFFLENSTRTKFSFQIAAQNLGMHIVDVDPNKSSTKKGESLQETFRTFAAQGIDILCMRSGEENLLEEFKKDSPLKLINGGDGTREHPSQALLDLMTLKELHGSLEDKKIVIVGDSKHSRVAGSLCKLLPKMGMQVHLCGPDYFLPTKSLGSELAPIKNLDEAIKQADALYLLRVQNERHLDDFDCDQYIKDYGLTKSKLNKDIPVLHPGPFNLDVEITEEIIESNNYKGYLQVENSIFTRMAIIYHMLLENL